VILNFPVSSEQYALTLSIHEDSWWLQWPQGSDDQGQYPADKIDHIFVSPGMVISGAQFIDDPILDHPAVTTVLSW
jgi:endonuclease/exonuclease/phosphatase family metal-dependent hydrolase